MGKGSGSLMTVVERQRTEAHKQTEADTCDHRWSTQKQKQHTKKQAFVEKAINK